MFTCNIWVSPCETLSHCRYCICICYSYTTWSHCRYYFLFKAVIIFGSKKDFKQAVRSTSMANGSICLMIQKGSKWVVHMDAHLKCGLSNIKVKDMGQLKSIFYEHNCVWNYRNKIVITKYLVDLYGDIIRKNKLETWKDAWRV